MRTALKPGLSQGQATRTGDAILVLVPSDLEDHHHHPVDVFLAWLSDPHVLMMPLLYNNRPHKLDTATLKHKHFSVGIDYSVYIVEFAKASQRCVEEILVESQEEDSPIAEVIKTKGRLQLAEEYKLKAVATLLKGEAVLIHTAGGERLSR